MRVDWFILIILFAPLPVVAQQYRFRHISNEDGLPQAVARALCQDRDGFMWVGTYAGLARYNGVGFDVFDMDDGLASDFIHWLCLDPEGSLWVATNSGLSRFKDGQFENYIPDTLNKAITRFGFDGSGKIWCISADGLLAFENERFELIGQRMGLPKTHVNDVFIDESHTTWVATDQGLYRSDQERFIIETRAGDKPILALAHDGSHLWLMRQQEVMVLLEDSETVFNEADGLDGLMGRMLFAANDGSIWFYMSSGIAFIEDGKVTAIREDAGFPVNSVEVILQDRDGLLWFGGTLGVAIFTGRAFTNYGKEQELASDAVRSLLLDKHDHLWVGTLRGLDRFDRKKWHHYRQEDGLTDSYIVVLRELKDGRVVAGTRQGAHFIEGDKVSDVEGLPVSQVNDFLEDETGQLWVALGNAGIMRGTNGNFSLVQIPNQSYKSGRMLIDSKKRVWIGGERGLSCWNGSSWRTYTEADGLANDRTYFLVENKRGDILFSYKGSYGFSVFDGNSFRTYTMADGLSSNSIYNIGEDKLGRLWLGSANGVDCLDGQTVTNYSPLEGYADYESNSGAFIADRDGTLWFGTMGGLSHYQPRFDNSSGPGSRPHIQELKLGEFMCDLSMPIRVDNAHNDLDVRISQLSFLPPQRLETQYRLVGENEQWQTLTGDRIHVTNLAPGTYQLEAQSRKYRGAFSRQVHVSFQIAPPFWATWWFRLLVISFITLLARSLYLLKVRRIEERNILLEQMVEARTQALRLETEEHGKARRALEDVQKQLLERAHKSGMAEIMSGVLHNIGNVLSSVGTSATLLCDQLNGSKVSRLKQVNSLLQEHRDDLPGFLEEDPKGKQLVPFLLELENRLGKEHQENVGNASRLLEKIENIKAYIKTHQSHGRAGFFAEDAFLSEVVEDALAIQSASLDRAGVIVKRAFEEVPKIRIHKIKLIQILINLIKNGKEAMEKSLERELQISILNGLDAITIVVTDTGCGIEPGQLEKVFGHGFTTKQKGYGFGLHSCANYMTEMGGSMWAESDGPNKGSSMHLSFPRQSQIPQEEG